MTKIETYRILGAKFDIYHKLDVQTNLVGTGTIFIVTNIYYKLDVQTNLVGTGTIFIVTVTILDQDPFDMVDKFVDLGGAYRAILKFLQSMSVVGV